MFMGNNTNFRDVILTYVPASQGSLRKNFPTIPVLEQMVFL